MPELLSGSLLNTLLSDKLQQRRQAIQDERQAQREFANKTYDSEKESIQAAVNTLNALDSLKEYLGALSPSEKDTGYIPAHLWNEMPSRAMNKDNIPQEVPAPLLGRLAMQLKNKDFREKRAKFNRLLDNATMASAVMGGKALTSPEYTLHTFKSPKMMSDDPVFKAEMDTGQDILLKNLETFVKRQIEAGNPQQNVMGVISPAFEKHPELVKRLAEKGYLFGR